MEKADHAGQSSAGLLVDELNALRLRAVELALDVLGLEAQVMEPAAALREELADTVIGTERFQQFDLALAGLQQRRLHALILHGLALDQAQPQQVAPQRHRLFEVRHYHAYMMNLFEHRQPSV